jgi:hypothetical protein
MVVESPGANRAGIQLADLSMASQDSRSLLSALQLGRPASLGMLLVTEMGTSKTV